MSSSTTCLPITATAMEYMDVSLNKPAGAPVLPISLLASVQQQTKRSADIELSTEEFEAKIRQARSEAAAQAEQRMQREYETKLNGLQSRLATTIEEFESQRGQYFDRIEAEVVQLALSIARKILHREAQVDPMLVAALVRITLEKMREGSSMSLRVAEGHGVAWREYFARHPKLSGLQVTEDRELSDGDCVLETELGSAHVGLEQQLKEVERGFFDLLALRPDNR